MSPTRKIRGPRTMGEILGWDDPLPLSYATNKQKMLTYALTKPRSIEGYVTLTQLAAERGIQAQLARLWAKRAGIKKPADGWRWESKSTTLKRVRKALGLP